MWGVGLSNECRDDCAERVFIEIYVGRDCGSNHCCEQFDFLLYTTCVFCGFFFFASVACLATLAMSGRNENQRKENIMGMFVQPPTFPFNQTAFREAHCESYLLSINPSSLESSTLRILHVKRCVHVHPMSGTHLRYLRVLAIQQLANIAQQLHIGLVLSTVGIGLTKGP